MKLRAKTFLIILLVLAISSSSFYLLLHFLLFRSFEHLETQEVHKNVGRALDYITTIDEDLTARTLDWSYWDDCYKFAQDKNPQFIKANLYEDILNMVKVNMMIFYSKKHGIIFSKIFDPDKNAHVDLPESLLKELQPGGRINNFKDEHDFKHGIIILDNRPVIFIARQILTSQKKGPTPGFIFFAKYMTEAFIKKMDSVTHLTNHIELQPDNLTMQNVAITPIDSYNINGTAYIPDFESHPHIKIQVTQPRDIYRQGLKTIWYILVSLVVLGFTMSFSILILLERLVIRRVARLNDEVVRIGNSGAFSERLPEEEQDELGSLTQSINKMLTDLQNSNQQIINYSKMSALGEMSSGIAHEINNPLSIISGYTKQALMHLQKYESVDKNMLNDILEKTNFMVVRISKIIKGLKAFSHQTDNDPFVLCRIETLFSDTLDFCQAKFASDNVDLQFINDYVGLDLECRPTQLVQVLLNLIGNARDAISNQKEKWVKVEVHDKGTQLQISVTDSGGGIPAEIRDKMMQPFFTTKEVGKGTGLGLSISKGIVEAHHGKLEIDANCPNTRFVITLPVSQPHNN